MSCTFLVWVTGEQGQVLGFRFPIRKPEMTPPTLQASLSAKGMGCNVPVKSQCSVSDSLTVIAFSFPGIPVQFSEQIQWLGGQREAPPGGPEPQGSQHQDKHECCPPLTFGVLSTPCPLWQLQSQNVACGWVGRSQWPLRDPLTWTQGALVAHSGLPVLAE